MKKKQKRLEISRESRVCILQIVWNKLLNKIANEPDVNKATLVKVRRVTEKLFKDDDDILEKLISYIIKNMGSLVTIHSHISPGRLNKVVDLCDSIIKNEETDIFWNKFEIANVSICDYVTINR